MLPKGSWSWTIQGNDDIFKFNFLRKIGLIQLLTLTTRIWIGTWIQPWTFKSSESDQVKIGLHLQHYSNVIKLEAKDDLWNVILLKKNSVDLNLVAIC